MLTVIGNNMDPNKSAEKEKIAKARETLKEHMIPLNVGKTFFIGSSFRLAPSNIKDKSLRTAGWVLIVQTDDKSVVSPDEWEGYPVTRREIAVPYKV